MKSKGRNVNTVNKYLTFIQFHNPKKQNKINMRNDQKHDPKIGLKIGLKYRIVPSSNARY